MKSSLPEETELRNALGRDALVAVTGANGGIGLALCKALHGAGIGLIMACRSRERGEAAAGEVRRAGGKGGIWVEEVDVARAESIDTFFERLKRSGLRPTHLVNNAGTMAPHLAFTPEGIEANLATNCYGALRMGDRMAELMAPGGIVVNTVSLTCRFGRFPPRAAQDGSRTYRGTYRRLQAYADSKLLLFVETARRVEAYRRRGIALHAADPGVVSTGMLRMGCWFDPLTDLLFRPFVRTPRQGAQAAIRALCHPQKSGLLFRAGSACPFPEYIRKLAQKPEGKAGKTS